MTEKPTRRRGEDLERAILDAAWDELARHGWSGFTIEGVAAASGTGKAAIYRRWPDKGELAQDLLRRLSPARTTRAEPMGSLRADLLEFLRIGADFLDGPFGEAVRGTLLDGDLHRRSAAGRKLDDPPVPDVAAAIERALASGELQVPPSRAVLNLGQILLSQEYLFSGAVDRRAQAVIVDELWLPAIQAAQAQRRR